jgi:hypothetical protein
MTDDGTLTREQLYEMVWSKPTTHLAKELGISDVALAKICKKLDVPKPKPGYWQQLGTGIAPAKPPLQSVPASTPGHVVLQGQSTPKRLKEFDPEAAALIEELRNGASRIEVSGRLTHLHPLVEASRAAFDNGEPDEFERIRGASGTQHLDIRASKKTLRRSLLVMDTLVKAIETRGFSVEIAKDDNRSTQAVVGAETVKIALWEEVRRSENPVPPPDAKDRWKRWSFAPTGTLVLMIDHYGTDGARKRWRDGKRRPLEEQLNDILVGIFTVAETKRAERLEVAEEERRCMEVRLRWERRERFRLAEEARRNALEDAASSWAKSRRLRDFLEACEARMKEEKDSPGREELGDQWLDWARRHADRLDPFQNGSVETLIREFTTSLKR